MVRRKIRHSRRHLRFATAVVVAALAFAWPEPPEADDGFITVASTTSTEATGLFAHLLPKFEADSGIGVRVVAVGTGQAIRLAERGDADVLFVHHPESEEAFVREGHGLARHEVMYNDFVVVGPQSDPAGVAGMENAAEAFAGIARAEASFVSRADDSGTHKAELELWQEAGIDPREMSGGWYREVGAGMGQAFNTAVNMDAYTLGDRGSWISFRNKGDHAILVEGDEALFNQYGVILVNPERHPHTKAVAGQTFIDWLRSPEGRAAIADFRVNGKEIFVPNAESNS